METIQPHKVRDSIGILFLLVPLIFSILNIQTFMTHFGSLSLGQLVAYINTILVLIGSIILFSKRGPFASIIKLWFCFFALYFVIGTAASFINDNPLPTLKSLIPCIYFFAFAIFLSIPQYKKVFTITATSAFFISTVLTIVFQRINFSMDYSGVYVYQLDRAGGVYGDANQAALVSILTLIFIFYTFIPKSDFQKVLKFLLMAICIYALVLTFSKTGFLVLLVVLCLIFHKLFTLKRLILAVFIIPIILLTGISSALNSESLTVVQRNRIQSIVDILTFNTQNLDYSGRDVLLKRMLNYVYDNPILGNGISFSNDISGHNTIIGVWADAGIITFLVFLLILFNYYRNAYLSEGHTRYLALSTIFVLSIFMLSLQSIINQPYLIAVFAYLGYVLENNKAIANVDDEYKAPGLNIPISLKRG